MLQNLQVTDNSHVALVSVKLHADSFALYCCDHPIPLSVNLGSLTKGDDDKCTLKATDDGDVLSLKYEASRACITMLAAGSTHIVCNLHSLGESVWAWVEGKAADMVDAVDALDVVGMVDVADVANAMDAADVVGMVGAADMVGTVDAVGAADAVGTADAVGAADAVGTADAVGAVDMVDTVGVVGAADAADMVDMVDAVDVVDMVGMADTVCGRQWVQRTWQFGEVKGNLEAGKNIDHNVVT